MFTHFRSAAILLGLTVGLSFCQAQEATGYALPDASLPKPQRLVQCIYQVADLVVPLKGSKEGTAQKLPDSLIRFLMCEVAPETWIENAGPGTIEYFPLGMVLVVNQTEDIHKQIAELLSGIRTVDYACKAAVQWYRDWSTPRLPSMTFERIQGGIE